MTATRVTKQDLGASVFAAPTIALGSAASAGTSGQATQTDATIAAFDVTAPSTQAFGDSAAVGAAAFAARRDHKHAMMAAPAAERAASSTAPAAIGTAAVGIGVTDARADHVHATGAGTPSTQAFSDSPAVGTGPTAAMSDHKHGMPASPGGLSAANFVFGETPGGAVNGSNAAFTCAQAPTAGTQRVYKNGIRQNVGAGLDYTFATLTITFLAGNIPQTGDILLVDYLK